MFIDTASVRRPNAWNFKFKFQYQQQLFLPFNYVSMMMFINSSFFSYCDCFSAGFYCSEACRCKECFNLRDYEDEVHESRECIEERDPHAFSPKIHSFVHNLWSLNFLTLHILIHRSLTCIMIINRRVEISWCQLYKNTENVADVRNQCACMSIVSAIRYINYRVFQIHVRLISLLSHASTNLFE